MDTDHTKVTQNQRKKCPREDANFISYIFFLWIAPIFFRGKGHEMGLNDLYQPLKSHKSAMLGDKISRAWDYEVQHKQEPSLMRAGLSVFGGRLLYSGLMFFVIEFAFRMTQPIFIMGLVGYYSAESGNINTAYLYAAGLIGCSVLSIIVTHPYMLSILHLGMKMRVSAVGLIYRKALRLTKNALGNTTAGQVVNLLSNDVGRFETSVLFIHYLWIGPLEALAVTVILTYVLDFWSAFVGVAVLLLIIPFQIYMGRVGAILRLKTALSTDERVRFMGEIIAGIQVIKMYAWEKPFAKVVEYVRGKELTTIRYASYVRGALLSFVMFTSRVSIFGSLALYVILGSQIDAKKAFVVTAYYNTLRLTMTTLFPQGIYQLAETLVSVKRLQKFLLYEELPRSKEQLERDALKKHDDEQEKTELPEEPEKGVQMKEMNGVSAYMNPSRNVIKVEEATAKWDENAPENTLSSVSLSIKPGELVAVIGPVGAGKSSLIQAILGELQLSSGSISVDGEISYASQEPWLFSASIRQNILFGLPMDRERYRKVVKVCALERDFTLFPQRDKTIVGERGTSLSGGQKARINLARAIYRKADIYLLDDPLSAVDSHVGRHLFDECIKTYLQGSVTLLVTHQVQYLQDADRIVLMEHGKIAAVGTYESLSRSGLDFTNLLARAEEETDEKCEESENNNMRLQQQIRRVSKRSSVFSIVSNLTEVVQEEKRDSGAIGLSVYSKYFKAAGGIGAACFLLFIFLLSQALASGGDYWVQYWVDKNQANLIECNPNRLYRSATNAWDDFTSSINEWWNDFYNDEYYDIYVFGIIVLFTIIISIWRSYLFFNACIKASQNLHNAMFSGITRATMYFFNTNPSGRILNRFSKDQGQVDEILPVTMIDMLQIFLSLVGILAILGIVNPYFLILSAILIISFWYLRRFYLRMSTNIKRIESTTRSPIFTHLSATLNGLSTIRAFKAEQLLIEEFDSHQDLNSSAYYLFISASRFFAFWLDACCVLFILLIIMSFFVMETSGGNVGLAITQVLGMMGMVQWGMRQSAEVENNMTCVERIAEYEDVDPEPPLDSTPDKKPPNSWPEEGNIRFDKLSLRYTPYLNTERVLKDLEFEIQAKEKVGIVGRTGAGKSTLINALFRLSYNEGSILIDTRDTNEIGLHDLRAKISIIPQEPVLFSGTMRHNLDPFNEYSDDKLWMALEQVQLKAAIQELPAGLQSKISEGGSNFSVGQRQLVCLARAILRENRILVMDEATANVDPQTDALIQETIRTKFHDCTVLTIAHRLNTVMDSDKVLVMDAGRAVEFGHPYELLTNDGPRVFHGMVKKTGTTSYDMLYKIAEQNYNRQKKEL